MNMDQQLSNNIHSHISIEGLAIAKFSRSVFKEMQLGKITAANCTCSVWENFNETINKLTIWNDHFKTNSDIICHIKSANDIIKAHSDGKVGIILGWQNTSAIEDDINKLQIFYDLGVRIAQLTYNTQNLVGSGCWEANDGGLSDFGKDVVSEMNRLGMVIDLSHVGPKTSSDTIKLSKMPVAYTHCCPAIKKHPRNKTDDQLKEIANRGGMIGFASYTPFLPKGTDSNIDDCVEAMEYMINIVGENSVGIGTDWVQDQNIEFFEYLQKDKGTGRFVSTPYKVVPPMPKGISKLSQFQNFGLAMKKSGWKTKRIEKVLGQNWFLFFKEVWK
ncbi:dipeptidase [Alphaproteobacteria bacterium]|nr:dipeptidase [Alphaproteobacteria bacterium]